METPRTVQDEKLADCFPPTLGCRFFSKIAENAPGSTCFLSGRCVELVAECLASYALCSKRGEWGIYDSVFFPQYGCGNPAERKWALFTDRQASVH